jgi:hypothetical protein
MIDILKFEKECFLGDIDKFIFYSNNKVIRQVINLRRFSIIQKYKTIKIDYYIKYLISYLKNPKLIISFGKDGNLLYSLPHHQVVDANSLRVNKQIVRSFIRETKINQILDN